MAFSAPFLLSPSLFSSRVCFWPSNIMEDKDGMDGMDGAGGKQKRASLFGRYVFTKDPRKRYNYSDADNVGYVPSSHRQTKTKKPSATDQISKSTIGTAQTTVTIPSTGVQATKLF